MPQDDDTAKHQWQSGPNGQQDPDPRLLLHAGWNISDISTLIITASALGRGVGAGPLLDWKEICGYLADNLVDGMSASGLTNEEMSKAFKHVREVAQRLKRDSQEPA